MSDKLTDNEVADRLLQMCYLEEIRQLRELNAELLEAAKAVAGAITEREQTQAMADLMAAIAKAEAIYKIPGEDFSALAKAEAMK